MLAVVTAKDMKILEVSFDEIQSAMEDVRRDRFDYYLDTATGRVIRIGASLLDDTIGALYRGVPDDDLDEDVEFDSEVITSPRLPEEVYDDLERAISVIPRSDRYFRIPERDREEAFRCMKRFASTVATGELREALLRSLNGQRAFRRFKDVLRANPKERKEWNRYNARAMQSVIREWLEENGIRPVRRRGGPGRAHGKDKKNGR